MRSSAAKLRPVVLIGTVLALALQGAASAQSPPAANPRAVAPDPAMEAARAAFEALPEPDRKAVQDALAWVGGYTAMADGSFGRQTYEAIAAYQRRLNQSPTGILDAKARASLRAAAAQAREQAGFEVVDDARSGVRIGIPGRLLTKRDVNQNGGSRWQSADDKITLDTRSVAEPNGLQDLFERNLAIKTPGRQVTYKLLRPDFFVIAGETPTGRFYTRYAAGEGGLRGFSLGYDKALAKDVDRLVVAIANSFTPFPVAAQTPAPAPSAAAPAQTPGVAPGPRIAPAPSASAAPAAPLAPKAAIAPPGTPRLIGTALVIAPRQAITTVPPEACANLQAGGRKPRQVRQAEGLTVLEFDETLRSAPFAVTDAAAEPDTPLLVLAYRQQGTEAQLVVVPGIVEQDGTLSAPLQAGMRGAPAFDRSGALRGLVRDGPDERRTVAGVIPPARYALQSGGLGGLIPAARPASAQPASTSVAAVAANLRAGVVPITCGP